MKICKKCKKKLELVDFYKHKGMLDGYLNICISCTRKRIQKHRAENIDKIREYDRSRGRTLKRLERVREYLKRNRELGRKNNKKWRGKNPEKIAAHIIVGNRIRSGKLVRQPCEVCGAIKVEAHHDDYGKPLEVRWLCKKHHAEIHRTYK